MSSVASRRKFLKQASFLVLAPSILLRNDILKSKTIPRIGFVTGAGYSEMDSAFTDELKKVGFIEGQNIIIERRFTKPNSSDGTTMPAELAQMDLSLIVAGALPFALEVR